MADLSPGDAWAIGVDVGGTKTKACLVRIADGAVLIEKTRTTPCAEGGAAVLDLVVAMAAETQREAGELTRGEACPVGVCLPELVSNEGEPESAWNFEWRGLDYRTPLSAFGPVYLESDVRAAAFAEGWIGAGGNADIFVYVTLSTGMSHTLVIGGKPYGGARGFAIHFAGAELVAWSGPDQDIEVRQNIEVFASGKGLGERYGVLVGDRNATARQLIEAAAADPRAERLLENSLLSIASYLGQLVNILDPSLMVIGGGIGSNPEINERLGELTRPFIFADLARDLPIVPAMLGDKACAIGVAALAHRAAPVRS
ncbi:ROK family protein [Mesorhizobium sp. YM1C-6-2]|uniref:ROK family protein n=1 Tax=Mesorhizobium sp. YM1C-6-2 TaxID=1827501 RepID=UPI0016007866|nr:ROK family protein [Mesorhizobium sp. YM1C-6-2]